MREGRGREREREGGEEKNTQINCLKLQILKKKKKKKKKKCVWCTVNLCIVFVEKTRIILNHLFTFSKFLQCICVCVCVCFNLGLKCSSNLLASRGKSLTERLFRDRRICVYSSH